LSWRDILKDAKTTSRTSGSFDFEEEEIPEQDEKDCKKELKKIFERAKNAKGKYGDVEIFIRSYDIFDPIGSMPEEFICKVLESFKNVTKDNYVTIPYNNFEADVFKDTGSYWADSGGEHGETMETTISIDKDDKEIFHIIVQYEMRRFEKDGPTPYPIKLYEALDKDSEKHKEYVAACKEVFGEYY